MSKLSTLRAGTSVLLMLACVLSCGVAVASSDVADAVMHRDSARLEQLVAAKSDVNAAQPDGTTALHWAASRGDVAVATALLKARASPNAITDTGVTPLALACEAGNADMVRALLTGGADVNQTLQNGETPLMMAARTGSVPVLELLLKRRPDIEAREKLRGTTALMWAAANANAPATRLLIKQGADIKARSATTAPGRKPAAKSVINQFEKPAAYARNGDKQWGGLTPLLFAVREGNLETVKVLLEAGADVNQTSEFGWTALLVATHDRFYQLGSYLLDHGADPNLANGGGWNPLYLATDNRNIEAGDYPTRKPDADHLEYIKRLLTAGANPNIRMQSSTETRTVFTNQWLYEEGATPFLRAAQSGDVVLMKLLLEHGADASIPTDHKVTPLMVASGIGWVEGVTYEWSPQSTLDAVKLLLDLGADVNAQDTLDGRTALMGAAHKGRNDVVQLLVERGADLARQDIGSRDSIHALAGVRWQAIDYADGLVRVGVQSAIGHPETSALLRRLMKERGLAVPAEGRTLASICITELCK